MKTSARNALRGVVASVADGAVNAEVVLDIGAGPQIVACHPPKRRGARPLPRAASHRPDQVQS